MAASARRKTSLSLDADALNAARELGVNVSAVADVALQEAVAQARRRKWLEENAGAFAEQAAWHERNGHPLAEILASHGADTWRR